MADYKDAYLIKAVVLACDHPELYDDFSEKIFSVDDVLTMIDSVKSADVEEVRRCEKCKYYRSVYCGEEYLYTVCLRFDIDSKPNDYCAWFELDGKEDA